MNSNQIAGVLRIVIPLAISVLGGMLGKSLLPGDVSAITEAIVNLALVVTSSGSVLWSWWANGNVARVASVAALSDEELHKAGVAKILTAANPVGAALAAFTPGNVVVQVGNPSPQTGVGRRS